MKTLARGLVLAWSVMWPLGAPAHAALAADPALDALAAAPELGSYEVGPIGVPRSTGKIGLTVTVIENGKPKTSTVTIASGVIQPYTSPSFDPLDDTDVRADKIAEQRGKFSQMKAQAIADAILKQTGIKAQAAVLPQEQRSGLHVRRGRPGPADPGAGPAGDRAARCGVAPGGGMPCGLETAPSPDGA